MTHTGANLKWCRKQIAGTIDTLERTLGITQALPLTIPLLEVSQQLSNLIHAEEVLCSE